MKTIRKQVMALAAALALTFGLAASSARASDALGSDRLHRDTLLATGTTLTENRLWSATYSDLRTERYLTYTPGGAVTPLLWYGSQSSSKSTLTTGAQRLAERGLRVVAGINGGFFNPSGTSVGLIVADGVIRSMDEWNAAMVGFLPDGSAFIDFEPVEKTFSWVDAEGNSRWMSLTAINADRQNGGVYLYDEDYGAATGNSLTGVDVALEPVNPGEKPTMNGTLTLRVTHVTDSTPEGAAADGAIPSGGFLLSANKNCDEASILAPLRSLTPGTEVTVTIQAGDGRWSEAVYGLTGLYSLVRWNRVEPDLAKGAAPRTALGIRPDGSVIFYTIDGRQNGYSIGATYAQVAQRLIELGCDTAVAMDGGGSTTLGATLPGEDALTVLNRPSDGYQRSVSNCLFLVTSTPASGVADHYYVDTAGDVILTGASTTVTAAPADALGYAAYSAAPLTWRSDGGTVAADDTGGALFTAGTAAGVYDVTATDGLASGSTPVRVVDALSQLKITRQGSGAASSLSLKPGDTVDLDASGAWYNLPVAMTDRNVIWAVEGNIGSIDENGFFTACENSAEGAITASAGGLTVRVPVSVTRDYPFADIASHPDRDYIARLYEMGVTEGIPAGDGAFVFQPEGALTRGEVLTFLSRLMKADTAQYENTALPFADLAEIPDWALPHVKALYSLGVFQGGANGGILTADTGDTLSREMVITMLGRLLAAQTDADLSVFTDSARVSDWAAPYVKSLLGYGVLASGGALEPQGAVTRGEMARLLVLTSALPLADLTGAQGAGEVTPAPDPSPSPEATPEPSPEPSLEVAPEPTAAPDITPEPTPDMYAPI